MLRMCKGSLFKNITYPSQDKSTFPSKMDQTGVSVTAAIQSGMVHALHGGQGGVSLHPL